MVSLPMEKIVTIFILIALLVIIVIFVIKTTGNTTPDKDIQKLEICANWLKEKCGIMETSYTEDLVSADICRPCEISETEKAGLTVDQIREKLEGMCGDEGDGNWTDCLRTCGCPDAPAAPE